MQLLGCLGHIHGYDLLIERDQIKVVRDNITQCVRTIKGLDNFVKRAKDLKIGWGQFEHDGDEVIYIYDKADEGFGYALNLDDHNCSEWGYSRCHNESCVRWR